MRLFASSGQAATSPALAHSSSDEAGEVIENSHTKRAGCSVLQSSGGKSRSLERYSGAPKIHQQTLEMLPPYATPTCSTRRRLLAPFRSLKRRSRSSSSSNESHHFGNHLNNLVVVNVGAAAANGGVAKAKAKASSQSGDSGTGGTELEHEMEQDDDEEDEEEGEEMDELSLSYSQLSSSGCEEAEATPEDVPDDRQAAVEATVSACVQHVANERRRNILSLYSSSSEEQLHCRLGDITLVDDTYSNYDPQNDAERMFLQVVGILRDENEVCVLANSGWLKYWSRL